MNRYNYIIYMYCWGHRARLSQLCHETQRWGQTSHETLTRSLQAKTMGSMRSSSSGSSSTSISNSSISCSSSSSDSSGSNNSR